MGTSKYWFKGAEGEKVYFILESRGTQREGWVPDSDSGVHMCYRDTELRWEHTKYHSHKGE